MLNPEVVALIEYRLNRARKTLEDAKLLFKHGRYNSCMNRLYYSVFYSVLALLRTENLMSSKHSGVRAMFHKEFVRKGIVPPELGKFYDEMFEFRQRGDYEDFVEFEKEKVSYCLEKVEEFVEFISKIVKNKTKG
ncbi:hypothetical protein CH333_09605 [candidate division WOR-3 bacterium JGI_Cruoil_03_44_89]|uniref:HEPN domain-containing protein n=1 Tax=candidate division WOR-3 bacterium JGI_Cruoil_03_44_89 TaxID=1973748 RepID=A0A235BN58_UNCW3|nr:MAG: hypothetical protein CH333_09605 [candidate division WOR-3 bacterium JGI_Cruoil_03_44_89]